MPDIPTFGIKWPTDIPTPLINRRQWCARHNRGNVPRWEQRKEIIKALWHCSEPGDPPGADYAWHRWNEKRLKGTCSHNWNTWAGPGGSGKTSDAAELALEWWLEAPHESAVIVCSTTKEMLRKRVWAQIAHFHNRLYERFGPKAKKENQFGELIDSETKIRWRSGDDKNCIFGMAVDDGPVEDAINNLIGIHTTRVWLILDEMQGVRPPIVSPKVLGNLAKNPESYFLGMGNPEHLNDPLGVHSEPLAGWGGVTLGETEEWETKGGPLKGNGLCQAFNGTRSPADDSPAERLRLPWLINREWVDAHLASVANNPQDPSYLSQAVGIWPMSGLEATVLSDQIITTFKCKEKAIWTERFTKFACLDPAFTADGDKCVLQFGKRGMTEIEAANEDEEKRVKIVPRKRKWMIEYGEWMVVPIVADSGIPVDYQIVAFCKKECEARGIPPEEFATDSTGVGGGLASIFKREWGNIYAVDFRGKPTDRPVSDTNPKPAYEEYDTRATELNFSVRQFAVAGSIRGLSSEACIDFCSRRTEYKNKKNRAEPKKEMKKRIGRSPDHGDVVAIGLDLCREKGAEPSLTPVTVNPESIRQALREAQDQFDPENYTHNEFADA